MLWLVRAFETGANVTFMKERVKSQSPRWLGVKEWDIGRTEQYAERRHYGEVQRWEDPLNWPGGLSLPDTSQAVKKHPSTSCSVLRAGSLNTHSWDSNVKNYISQTLLHPSKGGLDFKISFGGGGRETQFNHSSLLFPLERRTEVHSRFLLWWWLCSLVVAELIEKYFNFHSIECV